jgi:hypothetical protein
MRNGNILKALAAGFGALILTIMLAGCGGGSNSAATKHTVLVYMVGSDLESGGGAATADIAEMVKVGSSDNLKVVLETGGADTDGWRTVKRRLVQQGGVQTLADLGSLNMGLSQTLQDFVTWGVQTYPADKYTLVMWNHGGGSAGVNGTVYGFDEVHGYDGLSLPEIDQALKTSLAVTGKQFDVIGFDACLMATMEVANIASRYANYLVASQEAEPETGWDYTAWLQALQQDPGMKGDALGSVIADSYLASNQDASDITLSVTDLGKVEALMAGVGTLAGKAETSLMTNGSSARLPLAKARNLSVSYGKNVVYGDYTDMVDLKHLAQNLASVYPAEAANITGLLDEAVVYKVGSPDQHYSHGLAVYMPHRQIDSSDVSKQQTLQNILRHYADSSAPPSWQKLLNDYVQDAYNDTLPPVFQSESRVGDTISATVADEDLAQVGVMMGERLPGNQIRVWRLDSPDTMDASGKTTAGLELGAITLAGHPVAVYLVDTDPVSKDEYYDIPITYNGKEAALRIKMDDSEASEPEPVGLLVQNESGAAPRVEEPESGAIIQPYVQIISLADGEDTLEPYGESFVWSEDDDMDFSIEEQPPGTYVFMMMAEDFSGNLGLGELYTMTSP